MANVKISALPAATTPLAGTEVLPIAQSGVTRKVSVADLTLGRTITASSIIDSALTSGRVTYAGTSGVLQDNANLLFDGVTLTANTLSITNALGIGSGGTGQTAFTAGQIHFGSFSTSANLFWDNSNTRLGVGTNAPAVTASLVGTDAILIPKGTTAQQPTGVAGYLRFNTTTTQFEGYNGSTWASVGGAAISNDTSTSTNLYPLFASATSGTALTVYTGNTKYLYKPSTGELTAPAHISSNGIAVNANTVSTSYPIPSGNNGLSVGPISVASGQTVTVGSGQRWVIL
jgi:hypothetical protein